MSLTRQSQNRPVVDLAGRENFVENPGNNAQGFVGWTPDTNAKVLQTDTTTAAPQFHNQNTD